jgi:hypothetical protein
VFPRVQHGAPAKREHEAKAADIRRDCCPVTTTGATIVRFQNSLPPLVIAVVTYTTVSKCSSLNGSSVEHRSAAWDLSFGREVSADVPSPGLILTQHLVPCFNERHNTSDIVPECGAMVDDTLERGGSHAHIGRARAVEV